MTASAMTLSHAPFAETLGDTEIVDVIGGLEWSPSTFGDDAQVAMRALRTSASPHVRAAAAMALADHHAVGAEEAILHVLSRPDAAASSGTLLYALNELGGSLPLTVTVSILSNGSFEGRAEALTFFEEGRMIPASDEERQDARATLARLAASGGERAAAAALALDYLTELNQASSGPA